MEPYIKIIANNSIKMDYDFFRKNIITSRESCELLGISRQQLFNLVKKGSLKTLIHEKAFALFLRKDVMSLKYYMPFNASARIIDDSATVQQSIEFFRDNIDKLDNIESISIFKYKFDSASNGFFIPDNYVGIEELRFIKSPHLVIRDIKGKELWIRNCSCGCIGEATQNSKNILLELRDNHNINLNLSTEEIFDTICEHEILHFLFNSNAEIIAKQSEYKSDERNTVVCTDKANPEAIFWNSVFNHARKNGIQFREVTQNVADLL